MKVTAAAGLLVERVRSRRWGLAVVAISDGETSMQIDAGVDPVGRATAFQWGSVTKTMTGVLTAYAVEASELHPRSTLGEVLGIAGAAADITVAELATHRSGLPRLPPDFDAMNVDGSDPYAAYTESHLLHALESTEVGRKEYAYSNFGFMTLGRVLSIAGRAPYAGLLDSRILEPLGMSLTGCPPPDSGRAPGYSGTTQVPWWSTQLPGAGGVGGPIIDLGSYLQAHLAPPPGRLGDAIAKATTIQAAAPNPMGYGWAHEGGGWFHDGGTGGFRSFAAFHRQTGTAVGLLANSAQAEAVRNVGFATLTEMVRARL